MLLLAASLFFFPHYSVTHDNRPLSLVTDAKGNAYISSADLNRREVYLSKVDPDGRLIYRVLGGVEPSLATPDDQGNLYGVVNGDNGGTCCYMFATKIDPAGKVVYRLRLPAAEVHAPAVGPDGSAYFTALGRPAPPGYPPN